MKVETILLLVIGLVFLIDFLMKGFKKKPSSTEVDIKKEDDQDFKNTDNKPKKKTSLFGLVVVFVFGIPFSLIWSYLVALYYNSHPLYYNSRLNTFINSLIFFTIYLVFIAVFRNKINNLGVLKYISKRKKNISLVLIIIPFLKLILHYTLYPQEKKLYQKKFINEDNDEMEFWKMSTHDFGKHIEFVFEYELFLFIPSIIIVLFIAWYFNDKIKAK